MEYHSENKPTQKICPQPAIIEQHLKENVVFEGKIKGGDKICYMCYRSYLIILQTGKETSMDSDLLEVINTHPTKYTSLITTI